MQPFTWYRIAKQPITLKTERKNTMNAFIPYYDKGWHILEAPTARMRRFCKDWSCNGWIYGEHAFTTEEAAQAWIDKKYSFAYKLEYMPLLNH
jgi:hypothetical protein